MKIWLGFVPFVVLLAVFSFVKNPLKKETLSSPYVAKVLSIKGQATRRHPEVIGTRPLKKGDELTHLEFIQGEAQEVLLSFPQSGVVKLFGNFKMILQFSDKPKYSLLHLMDGKLEVVEPAKQKGLVKVYREGKTIDLASGSKKRNQPEFSKESLRKIISEQRPLFDKCYSSLLKTNPKASGNVDIYFEVESNGKVNASRIEKTNIKDEIFEKCLIQVFLRMSFPRFKGKKKKIIFPLQFGIN